MEGTLPMSDGRVFRVQPAGDVWEIEYLRPVYVDGKLNGYVPETTRPVYDKAVWLMWQAAVAPPNEE